MPVEYTPSPMGAVAEPDRTRDEPMSRPDHLGNEAAAVTVPAPQTLALALLVLTLEAAVGAALGAPAFDGQHAGAVRPDFDLAHQALL